MTEAALDGVWTHVLTGQPNRDFLPGGFELRSVALPSEPKPWVPLSRGECLLLEMALRRAVFAPCGDSSIRSLTGSDRTES